MNEKIRCFKNANGNWSVVIPPEFSGRFAAPGLYERATFEAANALVVARVTAVINVARVTAVIKKKAAKERDANRAIPMTSGVGYPPPPSPTLLRGSLEEVRRNVPGYPGQQAFLVDQNTMVVYH